MIVTLALLPTIAAFAPSLLYLWQAQNPSEENSTSWWFWLVLLLLLTLLVWWLLRRESSKPQVDANHQTLPPHAHTPHVQVVMPVSMPATEPAATPVTTSAPPQAESNGIQDNLTKIEGIGPKINGILHGSGIHTFADLAKTEVGRLREILLQAGLKVNDPTTWPEQAALAAEGKWSDLQSLQEQLDGGRRRV